MKARTIGYWAATGLTAVGFVMGGVSDLMHPAELTAGMAHLGYPAYFMTILGTWKVLGALAIVLPRLPLLKEWAYAGMVFDLTGAAVSHGSSGDPVSKIMTPLILLAIVAASWILRPESRRLPGTQGLLGASNDSLGSPARASA